MDRLDVYLLIVGAEIQNILIGQIVLFKVQLRKEEEFMKNCPYIVSMVCNSPDIVN